LATVVLPYRNCELLTDRIYLLNILLFGAIIKSFLNQNIIF